MAAVGPEHSANSIFAAAQSQSQYNHIHNHNLHLLMTHAYSINVQPIISMHMHQLPGWRLAVGVLRTYLVGNSWLSAHTHRPEPSAAAGRGAAVWTGAVAADPADWLSPRL